MAEPDTRDSAHTANILGALAVLIQDRVESAWQSSLDLSPMVAIIVLFVLMRVIGTVL